MVLPGREIEPRSASVKGTIGLCLGEEDVAEQVAHAPRPVAIHARRDQRHPGQHARENIVLAGRPTRSPRRSIAPASKRATSIIALVLEGA